MTVDNLPFAVLTAVDVGHAQGALFDRAIVQSPRGSFVAHCVSKVSTDSYRDKLKAVRSAV